MNWDEFRTTVAEAEEKNVGIVLTPAEGEWMLDSIEKIKGINKALREHYIGLEDDPSAQ